MSDEEHLNRPEPAPSSTSPHPAASTPVEKPADSAATPAPKAKEVDPLQAATSATTREGKVRLCELKKSLELYCHREKIDLSRASLKDFMAVLVVENGVQVPIEYVVLDGEKWLIRGYRRVAACEYLAEDNFPGFHLDMELPAREVLNATPADLVLRSILDNEYREPLKGVPRIKAVKLFVDLEVPDARAALVMKMTPQTYRRDKLIAMHPWMLELIIGHKIAQTAASVLLDEAVKVGRVSELRTDLEAWVGEKERVLDEQDRILQGKTGKGLRSGEKQVKKLLPNDLLAHWVIQIRKMERLAATPSSNVPVGFDANKEELYVGGKTMSLRDQTHVQVVETVGKLSKALKAMGLYAKKRYELAQLALDTASEDGIVDVNYLRALGLGSLANELTQEPARPAAHPAGDAKVESGDQDDRKDDGSTA